MTTPSAHATTHTARRHLGGETRRTVLPGGVRVLTRALPGNHTFSLGFFVDVGSRDESGPVHGAAHFLEHTLFKGTARRTAEEISAAIEAVGGDLNAYTGKEHTCFYAKVLADDEPVAVDVVSDMLSAPRLDPDDIDAERTVIMDEIAMHNDEPAEVAHELVTARLFGDHGLGLPIIGTTETVETMSRETIYRYFSEHYRASSIIVSAAGSVDHDHLVEELSGFVGAAGDGSAPRARPATEPYDGGPALLSAHLPLEQVTAVLGLRGVGANDDRRHALGLVSLILGGGMASRLFVEVRERRSLTYGIDTGESFYADGGMFTVEWQCHPDRLADIADLVRAGLADVAEHGVREDELARAKGQLRGQTLLAYERSSAWMSRLGSVELTGEQASVDELLERSEQVTADECRRVAAELFAGPPVLAVAGPRVDRRTTRRLEEWLG